VFVLAPLYKEEMIIFGRRKSKCRREKKGEDQRQQHTDEPSHGYDLLS
jgi:hypothetical protein